MASSSDSNVTSMEVENDDNSQNHKETTPKDFLPGFKTLQDYTQSGFRAVLEMTKTSNGLPDTENWPYYSSFPSFQDAMANQGTQIIKLMSTVLKSQGVRGNLTRRDMEEKFDLLLDANDMLLERVALNLDEVAGIRKNPENVEEEESRRTNKSMSGSWNQSPATKNTASPQATAAQKFNAAARHTRLLAAKVVEKPQRNFKDKIDNSMRPFEPVIKEKPNAKKPLSVLLELTEQGEGFSHPYSYELDLYEPLDEHLTETTPRQPRLIADTPCKFVNCGDTLRKMISDLNNYSELAIDLEHHSYRSFQGITCLMQISTHHCDYVIDTISLRSELHVLNKFFTNPKILKVLHGAESDVEWLQRDLGLYLVNMFDTHVAGKLIALPRLSLAYLVKHYCNVDMDKSYQLADWRLRPLLPEMIEYARTDTHYLLYIHDVMRNHLWQAANGSDRLIRATFMQSNIICKKVYIKPQYSDDDHLKLYQKSKKSFNNRQMWAFKELHNWRDQIARKEDESIGYVLPSHMLLQIAELLPREMQGILACCNPIPPLVRQNLGFLHRIILNARELSIIQTAVVQDGPINAPKESWTKINIESPLHCPHQLPPREELRNDLPTLLGGGFKDQKKRKSTLLSKTPHISLLDNNAIKQNSVVSSDGKEVLSPYQRYMLVKPYMEHLERQAEELQRASEKDEKPAAVVPSSDNDRMERIKQHFMSLDAVSVISAPPPASPETVTPVLEVKNEPQSGDEEEEEEEEAPPTKIRRVDHPDLVPKSVRAPTMSNKKLKKMQRKQKWEQKSSYQDVRVIKSQHDANEVPPENMQSIAETFDYSSVDFNRFQGGSKQQNRQQHRGGRGGKNSRGKGRKNFKFPQRQNEKSHTYKK